MKKFFIILVHLASLLWTSEASTFCPDFCRCTVDLRGRQTVSCLQGGLQDPIPIFDMEMNTKILHISAPSTRKNYLNLGPIFQSLRKLEDIHISYSSVPNIGEHTFWGLHHLTSLNLTWNHLTGLRDTNFKGAAALKFLDLSHNRIESIPSAVFRHVRNLITLSLAYNFIQELVPRIFYGLAQVEYLDLSYNPVQELPPDIFKDVRSLRVLKCSGCSLSTFKSTILQYIPNLRELKLTDNHLSRIPDNLLFSPYLTNLLLDHNHISFVERHMFAHTRIEKLSLSHNEIIRAETEAFMNSSIFDLDLSYNNIVHMSPSSFKGIFKQLRILKLSGNSINVVTLIKILHEIEDLHELGLGDVGLTNIHTELLKNGKNIRKLNISANYLTTLPFEIFTSCPNLQVLDLSMNSFRGLSTEILNTISNSKDMRVLKLEGNPWLCDRCHMLSLLTWLQDAPDQESGCSEPRVWTCLKCFGPPKYAGLELALLPTGDLPMCKEHLRERDKLKNLTVIPGYSLADQPPQRYDVDPYETASSDMEIVEIRPPSWDIPNILNKEIYTIITVIGAFFVSVVIVILILSLIYRNQSADYYTHEPPIYPSSPTNNNVHAKASKKASIATIDEVSDIAGSTEFIENSKNRKNKKQKKNKKKSDDLKNTIVDECGKTKICNSSDLLIEILDSEPRPGKS